MNQDEYRDRGYECIVQAASNCATSTSDNIDDETRDAARAFLRSEFKRWEEGAGEIEPEADDEETGGD